MNTYDIPNHALPLKRYRVALTACVLILLSACVSAPKTAKGKATHKTPQNISVGAGPNRELAAYAMKFLGTPYKYGGSSPSEGFDCSGLVQYTAKKTFGLNLPRRAADQGNYGKSIRLSELKAGDLLFFNTSGQPYSHVGIYVGQTYFIHAPTSGGEVRIEDYSKTYWTQRLTATRRIQ